MISFLFTNIFIHIQQLHCHSTYTKIHIQRHISQLRIYSFTFATYIHSHSRSKFLFNTVAIFIQHLVKGAKFTNSIPFTFNEFIPFLKYIHLHSRHEIFIHIQRQNFYSTLLYIHSTFCTHPSLRIIGSQALACSIFWKDVTKFSRQN